MHALSWYQGFVLINTSSGTNLIQLYVDIFIISLLNAPL